MCVCVCYLMNRTSICSQCYQTIMSYEAPTIYQTEQVRPNTTPEAQLPTISQENLLDAIKDIKNPQLLAQEMEEDQLEISCFKGKCHTFRDNGSITQEMLNGYCLEALRSTGGSSFYGVRQAMDKQGRVPVRCYYNMDYGMSIGAGGISGVNSHVRVLDRLSPLCAKFYSPQHIGHSNGTRCGIAIPNTPSSGKGRLTW